MTPLALLRTVSATALVAATAVACSDWPTGRSDRTAVEPVEFNMEVAGELGSGEVREFEVQGVKARTFRVLFQAQTGDPHDTLHLDVVGATTGYQLATVSSAGDSATSTGQATAWRTFPGSVPYLVRVRGARPDHAGSFRFRIETPHRPIEVGDTVIGMVPAGRIGELMDEYWFQGQANQTIAVRFQLRNPASGSALRLGLSGPAADTSLVWVFEAPSGFRHFVTPSDGEYTVHVTGGEFHRTAAEYEFELHAVDRRPETMPAELSVGDTVHGEKIDHFGDIDEFRLPLEAGSTTRVIIDPDGRWWAYHLRGLIVEIRDGEGTLVIRSDRRDTWFTPATSGDYTVAIVARPTAPPWFTGPFSVEARSVCSSMYCY